MKTVCRRTDSVQADSVSVDRPVLPASTTRRVCVKIVEFASRGSVAERHANIFTGNPSCGHGVRDMRYSQLPPYEAERGRRGWGARLGLGVALCGSVCVGGVTAFGVTVSRILHFDALW